MTTSASAVIKKAESQLGYHEGYSNGHWNNNQKFSDQVPGLEWSDWQAWCATFVSWCAMKADAADLFPRTASCLTGVSWFRQRDRFSYYPAVGAQVFFGHNGGTHTGIVVRYDGTYIWTVEGNTNSNGSPEGDGVYAKKHRRRDDYVYGYGYPDYPEGITSADPEWKGHKKSAGTHVQGGASSKVETSSPVVRYRVTIDGKQYGYGAKGPQVTAVGKALVAAGFGKHYKEGPGPNWTDADTRNYADYQESLGYSGKDADGVPGPTSLHKLMGKKSSSKPTVDLSQLISAAKKNPPAKGQPVTYSGVKPVEKALVAEGLLDKRYADGHFGTTTIHAYSQWQKRYSRNHRLRWRGGDVNGIPGYTSLKALGDKHGFNVKR